MRIRTIITAVIVGVAGMVSPVSAGVSTVEAEARARDAGYCASDGERVDTHPWADTSGSAILFLPHDRCWAEWDLDSPIESITMTVLRPNGTGSGIRECHVFDVRIDGQAVGSSAEQCGSPNEPQVWQVLPLVESLRLPPGNHTLRVTMRITQGPSWGNAYIDYLTVVGHPPGTPSEPLNVAARWELAERRVVVGWDAPESPGAAPVTGYLVYRAEGTSSEQLVATLGDVRTFADTDVLPGRTYGYRVSAVNDEGEGVGSAPAIVSVPGGTLFSATVPVGPSEPISVVTIAGRNNGALYCLSAAVRSAPPSDLACVNVFGATVPDVGPITLAVPAGTTAIVGGSYYYEPERVVTAATVLGGGAVVRSPVAPADAGWLLTNAGLVGVEITLGSANITIPALGQVVGALHESSVAGQPLVK